MKIIFLSLCLIIAGQFSLINAAVAKGNLPRCPREMTPENVKIYMGVDECYGYYQFSETFRRGSMSVKSESEYRWFTVDELKKFFAEDYELHNSVYKKLGWGSMGNRYLMTGFGRHMIWSDLPGSSTSYTGDYFAGVNHGFGVRQRTDGVVEKGIFRKGKFIRASERPQNSPLKNAFIKLSKNKRKKLQSNLKDLGLYKPSVDGLYGKGTAGALRAYNKQNLNGLDLEKSENVGKLIKAVLGLEPAPKEVPDNKSDNTYKVASGSGFYVSEQGHIVTNHHVIEGCQNIKVHSKGNVLETKKIADDKRNDLALLKISENPKHAFALSTESPFPLQEIVVAGYPFGDTVSSTLKFTQGIVSAVAGLGNDYSQIQIDAALQPGNSGGPILDDYGNVVAVAVAKLSLKKILKDYGVVPENTNFGVKVSAVRNLMEGNGVAFKSPNTEIISKRELSKIATGGTVFLSCWMTTAQIEQLRLKKVMFEDLK